MTTTTIPPTISDLTSLAEKLQETAQALLASYQKSRKHDDSDGAEGSAESSSDIGVAPAKPDTPSFAMNG